jgi:glycosyltransferase involved in cell wall biosynthesis
MKIAVYTICLNEERNVDAWARSALGADYIVVADTGSTDLTVSEFAARGISPSLISIRPWRFDDAHNAALALVPGDADVCIPLHLDERLETGWRALIEAAWTPTTTKAFYTYQFSESLTFLQNRIHARAGYRWKYPDHEGVYPYGDTKEESVTIEALRIVQQQDRSKDRSQILERLRWGVAENPSDARPLFYLGRELFYRGEWHEAIHHLEAYMRLPMTFALERSQAAQCLADCWKAIS